MASRGLRGRPDRVLVGTKVVPTVPSVAKALDDKIQAIEDTEAEAAHQFSSFSTDAKPMGAIAPKTPRRPGRPSEGRLSTSGAVRTPTRDEQALRANRATPSKSSAPMPSSVLRPTAASLMRQQSSMSGTPTRTSSTPVKPVRTPVQARSTPLTAKTPLMRSTPTRSVAPPSAVRATPNRGASVARSTPTRTAPVARSTHASTKKPAVPSVQDNKAGAGEGRSDARSLLEAREELQRVQNVLLQAVLANAKASAAACAQECRAEAELFTDWNQLEVLRKELASAQHKLARDTHTMGLRMNLHAQAEQAGQASEWLLQFVASYSALSRALEHITHLMPAPNSVYSAPTVLAAFQETNNSLQQLQRVSLQTSNVPQASATIARLAAVLTEEESELARLQELLAMHTQLENYERSLRIQAIQNSALPPITTPIETM